MSIQAKFRIEFGWEAGQCFMSLRESDAAQVLNIMGRKEFSDGSTNASS